MIDPDLSAQWRYYFLKGLSLTLNNFIPQIIEFNGSQAGRLMYHFKSSIALPNMILTAISRIVDLPDTVGPPGARRVL
jgi:hypothetical protein